MVKSQQSYEAKLEEANELNKISSGVVVLGNLIDMSVKGLVVSYSIDGEIFQNFAISSCESGALQVGFTVALIFVEGNPNRPIIIGKVAEPVKEISLPLDAVIEQSEKIFEHGDIEVFEGSSNQTESSGSSVTVNHQSSDEEIVIEGKKKITLKCGESSLTLTNTGKILLRGKYVQSRALNTNRIMGGSVQIN